MKMSFMQELLCFFLIVQHTKGSLPIQNVNNLQTYNIETLCNNREEKKVILPKWSAANFQFGKINNEVKQNKIHKCKIKISTEDNFGLAAAIEEMNIQGRKIGHKWQCSDYVEFTSYGKSFLQKVFGKFDLDLLSHANSDKLCGKKSLKGYLTKRSQIIDVSTEANSFYTNSNTVFLYFHQDNDSPKYNNSFSIIVTTFGQGRGRGSCEGKYKCRRDPTMCIHSNFTCDGHVNCAIPKSGSDEIDCDSDGEQSYFNPIAVTMIVLSGLVAIILGLCILVTIICQFRKKPHARSREEHRQRMREQMNAAMTSAAPQYESVILSDAEQPKPNIDDDLPPSYDALFPKEDVTKHS